MGREMACCLDAKSARATDGYGKARRNDKGGKATDSARYAVVEHPAEPECVPVAAGEGGARRSSTTKNSGGEPLAAGAVGDASIAAGP